MIRCGTPVPGTTPGAIHAGYVTALTSRLVQYVRTFSEEPAYTPHCILVTQTESRVETATTEAGTSLLRSAVIQPPKAQSFSDFGGGGAMDEMAMFIPGLDLPLHLQITNAILELVDLNSYRYEYSVSVEFGKARFWLCGRPFQISKKWTFMLCSEVYLCSPSSALWSVSNTNRSHSPS